VSEERTAWRAPAARHGDATDTGRPEAGWAVAPDPASTAAALMRLQRTAGNRAVAGVLARREPAGGGAATGASEDPDPWVIEFFEQLWAEDPASVVRLALEVGRLMPAVGLASGAIADVIGAYQDITAIPTGDAFLATVAGGLISFRSVMNVVTNAVGQVEYVDQLVSDYLASQTVAQTLTGLGIAADTITVPLLGFTVTVNGAATVAKAELTGVMLTLDSLVAFMAGFSSAAGPPADSVKWGELALGYVANVAGDLAGLVNEVAGFFSGGFSQSGAIGQAITSLKNILVILSRASGVSKDLVLGIWNVLGGKAIGDFPDLFPEDEGLSPRPEPGPGRGPSVGPTAGPAPILARATRGLSREPAGNGATPGWRRARMAEVDAASGAVARGDEILESIAGQIDPLLEAAARMAEEAGGGQEALPAIRAGLENALAELEGRLGTVDDLGAQSSALMEEMTGRSEAIAAVVASIESLRLPEIELPDGGVAGTVIQAGLDQIASALESAKELVLVPLRELQAQLAGFAELVVAARSAAETLSAQLAEMTVRLHDSIEQAGTLPEMLQAIVDQALGLTGVAGGMSFDDLRSRWAELGPAIDEARTALAAGTGPPPEVFPG
jgi:hypothetical protein